MEINKIFNEDCLLTMSRINNKVNAIITSPPYNTGGRVEYWSNKIIDGVRVYSQEKRYDEYLDTKTSDEYIDWTINLFNSYNKILVENGVVLYNISYGNESPETMWLLIADIIKNTEFTVADCISWKKTTALPNTTSKNKYIEASNNDGSNELNKATYSTDLVRKLLLLYTQENDLIYDSFMGTGTTANACIIEKRNYLGSEISKEQCKFAEKRLNIIISQPKLF